MIIVDYEILVQNLVPPLGLFKHYAVIQFLIIETEKGNKKIDLGFGETYGKTEDEARAKMQAKFDSWRKENGS
ncbi:MAG: hypothetical protein ABL920_06335 [Methylotenera sp.]|nr:hypothetical protein [Methylotenera sp.]